MDTLFLQVDRDYTVGCWERANVYSPQGVHEVRFMTSGNIKAIATGWVHFMLSVYVLYILRRCDQKTPGIFVTEQY